MLEIHFTAFILLLCDDLLETYCNIDAARSNFSALALMLQTLFILVSREVHERQAFDHNFWLDNYNDTVFFQLFRMKKKTLLTDY